MYWTYCCERTTRDLKSGRSPVRPRPWPPLRKPPRVFGAVFSCAGSVRDHDDLVLVLVDDSPRRFGRHEPVAGDAVGAEDFQVARGPGDERLGGLLEPGGRARVDGVVVDGRIDRGGIRVVRLVPGVVGPAALLLLISQPAGPAEVVDQTEEAGVPAFVVGLGALESDVRHGEVIAGQPALRRTSEPRKAVSGPSRRLRPPAKGSPPGAATRTGEPTCD